MFYVVQMEAILSRNNLLKLHDTNVINARLFLMLELQAARKKSHA
jgi:hypothetical protein